MVGVGLIGVGETGCVGSPVRQVDAGAVVQRAGLEGKPRPGFGMIVVVSAVKVAFGAAAATAAASSPAIKLMVFMVVREMVTDAAVVVAEPAPLEAVSVKLISWNWSPLTAV